MFAPHITVPLLRESYEVFSKTSRNWWVDINVTEEVSLITHVFNCYV